MKITELNVVELSHKESVTIGAGYFWKWVGGMLYKYYKMAMESECPMVYMGGA